MSTAHWRLKSPRSLSGTSAHPTMVIQVNIMVMNGWLTSFSIIINRPPHFWEKLFQTLTLKLQGQGHGCGQRESPTIDPVSYLLTSFSFHINQTNNSGEGYFKIWPWNIQGQGHEWSQRSRSHIVPSIQPMHFFFVSHQWDQPFLRYDQNNVWPWKNTSEFFF